MRKFLSLSVGTAVLLLTVLLADVTAQGPFTAQIQRAIRALTSGTTTFTNAVVQLNGIAATPTTGLTLQNTTAATGAVTVQEPPGTLSCGAAWNSVGVVSETDCLRQTLQPLSAAGTTSWAWLLERSIAGGAYSTAYNFNSSGSMFAFGPDASNGGGFTARTSDSSAGMRMFVDSSSGYIGTTTAHPTVVQVSGTEVSRFVVQGLAVNGSGGLTLANTAPTLSSGFGTSPVFTGKAAAFQVNVGTGGSATGGVIAMNATALNGWNCVVFNITALAANRVGQETVETASTTTTVTVQNQTIATGAALAWTASDVVRLACLAY